MKFYILILSCLCTSWAYTIRYETTEKSNKPTNEYKTELKDIRLVAQNQVQSDQKVAGNKQPEFAALERSNIVKNSKINYQPTQSNSRKDQKKFGISQAPQSARVGRTQGNFKNDETHQKYLQKIADQLYIAQKHASLLSDYQKYIISQDEHAKSYVLSQAAQVRVPKPFSQPKETGGGITIEPVEVKYIEPTPKNELKKIVVVNPKIQTSSEKISLRQNDHSPQPTNIKYVTLPPQSLSHFVATPATPKQVPVVQYQPSPAYTSYDLGITSKPLVKPIQIQTVPVHVPVGVEYYKLPQHHGFESGQLDDHHKSKLNYQFKYKVLDHKEQNHFGHAQSRTEKATFGQYFVHLPDGRIETVKYWADKTGYHAKVDYVGEAKHPSAEKQYQVHSKYAHL